MFNLQPQHYALIAGFLGALAIQISSLDSWAHATSPAFVGGVIAQMGTFLGALYVNKPRDASSANSRSTDPKPEDKE